MPAPPRLRQLRRDKTVFGFVVNVVRLDLEEDERLALQPGLQDAPDEALQHLRRVRQYWQGVAAIYVMRKSHCSPDAAVRVTEELRDELGDELPEAEIRAVPLREVLDVPVEHLPAFLRPPAGPAA
ncbi:hypothetical protein [Hymenobacter rubidus]|uniref:hypothetical protein n=1 Tax=Hymenobacter rubidus TaxID=1441626 RepID=UPI00191F946B|nr:hypothetical protein [Hymenobacter rubidus]